MLIRQESVLPPAPRPLSNRVPLRALRARIEIRDRNAGVAHGHAGADLQPPVGLPDPRRTPIAIRHRRRGGGAHGNCMALDVGRIRGGIARARLR